MFKEIQEMCEFLSKTHFYIMAETSHYKILVELEVIALEQCHYLVISK